MNDGELQDRVTNNHQNANIKAVPSIMNAVILIAVLSVGNSSVYASSRTMAALADRGQAPKILSYIDRTGRPLVAIIVASAFGFICYIVAAGADTRNEAFNWMLALSGLSAIFTWYVHPILPLLPHNT